METEIVEKHSILIARNETVLDRAAISECGSNVRNRVSRGAHRLGGGSVYYADICS
jgi:hypothetical protein